jgi:hypothetical protein
VLDDLSRVDHENLDAALGVAPLDHIFHVAWWGDTRSAGSNTQYQRGDLLVFLNHLFQNLAEFAAKDKGFGSNSSLLGAFLGQRQQKLAHLDQFCLNVYEHRSCDVI